MNSISQSGRIIDIGFPYGTYSGLKSHFSMTQDFATNESGIEILSSWIPALEALQDFGPYFCFTMNASMAIGRCFDELLFHAQGERIAEIDGSLSINPLAVGSMVIAEEKMENGLLISIQLFDRNKRGFLKICLTAESSINRFHHWVQECLALESGAVSQIGIQPFRDLQQIDRKESSQGQGFAQKVSQCESIDIPRGLLAQVVSLAVDLGIPLQFQAVSPGISHAESFWIENTQRNEKVLLCEADGVNVFINEEKIERVRLAKPSGSPHYPFALNLYERCRCRCSVILPAVPPTDPRIREWNQTIDNWVRSLNNGSDNAHRGSVRTG
ncbi:MAG: hypothetical protein AAFY98_12175, partial [Verrucomicrobiota bacterium]